MTTSAHYPLRLLVVDDYALVRAGLRSLIGQLEPETEVFEAGSVAGAIAAALAHRPDVVIMDVRLGDGSGIDATREIRHRLPATRVLMFTSYPDDEALAAAASAGASGFLLKEVGNGELIRAIKAVVSGENLLETGAHKEIRA